MTATLQAPTSKVLRDEVVADIVAEADRLRDIWNDEGYVEVDLEPGDSTRYELLVEAEADKPTWVSVENMGIYFTLPPLDEWPTRAWFVEKADSSLSPAYTGEVIRVFIESLLGIERVDVVPPFLNMAPLFDLLRQVAETEKRATELAAGLREFADFIEAHPHHTQPKYGTMMEWIATEHTVPGTYQMDDEEKAANRAALIPSFARHLSAGTTPDNPMKRDIEKDKITMTRSFGPIRLYAEFGTEGVCKMVPTGETEQMTTYEIPDEVRAAYTIPEEIKKQYMVTIEVPVTERVCPDSLLSL